MNKKRRSTLKSILALLIVMIMTVTMLPLNVMADEWLPGIMDGGQDSFTAPGSTVKIHEVSATGPVVAKAINGSLTWSKVFEPDKDYYIEIEIDKSMGGKYLEVSTKLFDSGELSGIKFQNMPGQDGGLGVKELDQTSTLSHIVYYENYPDRKYGAKNYNYTLEDGKVIYRIAESKDAQADAKIGFNLGFKLDPALYNNASRLMDALEIKIGDYDAETHSVTAMDGYEQSINIFSIQQRVASTSVYSTSAVSAILDEPVALDTYLRIGNTGEARFIFNTLEFDLYIPDGVSLDGIGFDAKFVKTHENYGTISCSEMLRDSEGKTYYHVTVRDGMKYASDIQIHFSNTVSSSVYKIDDKINIQTKNIYATLANGERYTFNNPSDMVITVIDPENDASVLVPHNREIYNSTIDTDEKYNIQLGRCSVRNPGSSETPYDKIFEAQYNTNNSDAVITAITIPVGSYENPEIIIEGYDENKNPVTYTVPDPKKYIFKSSANSKKELGADTFDYGFLIFASDCGMAEIKSVKATIGKIKSLYNETEPWSTVQYYEYSVAGCYGYFTNDNSGIQVTSTYHLYNENPAYRTRKNGDLFATCVYTSTDRKSLTMASTSLNVYGWRKNAKTGNTEEYKISTVSASSSDTAPAIAPGESVKLSSCLLPYSATFSTFETSNTKDAMVKSPATDQYRCTVEYLADPVFYLTLPGDFRLEDIKFTQDERTTYINESDSDIFYTNHTDSVYSSKDNCKWTSRPLNYTIENITYLNKTGDGRNLYKITFPEEEHAGIGRYSEDGKMKRITYTVTIGTSKSSATKRYPMSDLMQISGENPYYGGIYNDGITNSCYTVYDRYGLNNNHDISGVTYGAYEAGSQWGFSLQKLSDVNSYNFITATEINSKPVSQDWYTYMPTDANSIVLLGKRSKGRYKFMVQNTDTTHPTQKLQAIVPIPTKDVDLGSAFMDGPMEYSMDFTWQDRDVPDGFTVKYINIKKTESYQLEKELDYTECDKSKANAILIETPSLEQGRTAEMYFDFSIGDDVNPADINIFQNALRYVDFAGNTQTRLGSEVAVEVAAGRISGKAYYDENRNATYDDEEPVEGVNVRVVDSLGKFQYVTTDAYGNYEFSAVRETDVTITFSIDKSSEYRINVPAKKLTIASDCLSASNKYTSLVEEDLDLPLDKYITLSYNANPPQGKTATGVIPKTTEYYKNQEAKVSSKPDSMQVHNYKFINWNTMPDGSGTSYEPNETFNITENTVLYAQWEKMQLYLTFDFQGGTVATFNKDLLNKSSGKDKREAILASINEENLEKGLVKIPIEEKESIRTAMAKYFFGHKETDDNNTYQLWFLMPISNNDSENMKKEYGIDYYNYFRTTKNGYDAIIRDKVGDGPWYVKNANGTTRNISFGTYFTESTTIYLRWTPKSGYAVKYDTDGGNIIEDTVNLNWESDVYAVAKTKIPVKPGYTFSYWEFNGERLSANDLYGELAVVDTVGSITLKAVYTAKNYKVNYDSNGGTAVDSRNVAFAQANMNSLTAPTKTDYVFEGWSTDGSRENIITADTTYSDIVGGDEDVLETTLYAVWKEATGYTVLFDTNGGTAVADKTDLAFNSANLIGDTSTSRAGYVFKGWYLDEKQITDADRYSSLVDNDTSVTSITLKAEWTDKEYTIKYTNVVTPIEDKTAKWESNTLLPQDNPVRVGYRFNGWSFEGTNVNQSNTVAQLIPNDNAKDNTLVMTANWDRLKYSVVYNSNGGTYVNALTDKTVETSNLVPSNVTREGYAIEGWYTESGVKISSATTIGDIVQGDETTVKLNARWTAKQGFTVKYNLAGGKSADGKDTIADKSVAWTDSGLLPAEPVRSGYKFLNWTYGTKIVDNATEFGYLAGTESNNPITLVATWEKVEYKINPQFIGATLLFDTKIGVNFYVYMDGKAVLDKTTGTYTLEDMHYDLAEQYEVHFSFKDSNGNYVTENGKLKEEIVQFNRDELSFINVSGTVRPLFRFTHWCYSFEMADMIEARIYQGSTQTAAKGVQYSVVTYANRMMGKYGTDFDNTLKGMLNFGTSSQMYWNYETGNPANKILSEKDKSLEGADFSKYAVQKTENISGITGSAISLGFTKGSGFDLKLSIDTDGEFSMADLSSATLSSDTMYYMFDKSSSQVKIDKPYNLMTDITAQAKEKIITHYELNIKNIPVYRWDDFVTVTLTDRSGNVYSIKFCLLSYANAVVNSSEDAKLVNLMQSMCLYNELSANYFADVEEYENKYGLTR